MALLKVGHTTAQDNQLIRVKGGEDIQKAIAMGDRYRYPTFQNGTVRFHSGKSISSLLNYNLLLGEIHFISPTKDTLALANENTIKEIKIANNLFYFSPENGYLEIIAEGNSLKVAVKQIFRVAGVEKMGAYEQSSAVSSIKNYSVLSSTNGSIQKLEAKGDIVLSKEKLHFFIDQNNRFYKATKSTLFKIFPKHKREIETYIKENHIDFKDDNHLKKIILFSNQLM